MGKVRIHPVSPTPSSGISGYRIQEVVHQLGYFIEWGELFGSYESAEQHLFKLGYKKDVAATNWEFAK